MVYLHTIRQRDGGRLRRRQASGTFSILIGAKSSLRGSRNPHPDSCGLRRQVERASPSGPHRSVLALQPRCCSQAPARCLRGPRRGVAPIPVGRCQAPPQTGAGRTCSLGRGREAGWGWGRGRPSGRGPARSRHTHRAGESAPRLGTHGACAPRLPAPPPSPPPGRAHPRACALRIPGAAAAMLNPYREASGGERGRPRARGRPGGAW